MVRSLFQHVCSCNYCRSSMPQNS